MFVVWILFAVVVWAIAIILVKWDNFKRLWLAGIVGMAVALVIDSVLGNGGLYTYHYGGISLYGVPVFYILALYAGSIFVIHFYPWGNMGRGFLFFILANAIFLFFEFLTSLIGVFEHLQWSFIHSFILNFIGFLVTVYVYALLKNIFSKIKYTL